MTTKLHELILHIARESEHDPDFGLTKLHKILFNADFAFYRRHGRSITNEEYQKLPFGPAVRRLMPTLEAGVRTGDVSLEEGSGDFAHRRVIGHRDANLTMFTDQEIEMVNAAIQRLRGMNATEVSDMSHNFIGWQLADEKELIPYQSVYLSRDPLTESEKALALNVRTAI